MTTCLAYVTVRLLDEGCAVDAPPIPRSQLDAALRALDGMAASIAEHLHVKSAEPSSPDARGLVQLRLRMSCRVPDDGYLDGLDVRAIQERFTTLASCAYSYILLSERSVYFGWILPAVQP